MMGSHWHRLIARTAAVGLGVVMSIVTAVPAQAAGACTDEKEAAREAKAARTAAYAALEDYLDTAFEEFRQARDRLGQTLRAFQDAGLARRQARDAYKADRSAENRQALADAVLARDAAWEDHLESRRSYRAALSGFRAIRIERARLTQNIHAARSSRAAAVEARTACLNAP